MKELSFFDVKTRKKFTTTNYKLKKTANGRTMAATVAPSGSKASVFVSKDFKE